jgi:hypothetical protein
MNSDILFTLIFAIGFIPALAQTPATPQGTIALDRGWQTTIQGGSATMKDWGVLLSPFAQPLAVTPPVKSASFRV